MSDKAKFSKVIQYTQAVRVTVDRSMFTDEFLAEFRESFYDFDTIDDHLKHLGQLFCRGLASETDSYIEGYGEPSRFGIKFEMEYDDLELA